LQLAFEAGTLRCLLIDHLGEIKLKAANMPQLVQGQWHKVPKEELVTGSAEQVHSRHSQNLTLTFPLHRVEYRSILCSTTHENLLIMILVYI
jgi:hypothetical protein